jgi:hypothetical protein
MQHATALSHDQIHRKAPSILAEIPFEKMSQKYRLFHKCEVVQAGSVSVPVRLSFP